MFDHPGTPDAPDLAQPALGPRHPAREAAGAVGDPGLTVRVLEPSPPAVTDEPYLADDPADRGEGARVLTPTSAGDVTWAELLDDRPDLADFARRRRLVAGHPLAPLPDGLMATRDDLHRLAYGVVAEARRVATAKFGLRATLDGFGTPFFASDEQVRVVGDRLVHQRGATARDAPITTLAAAAAFVGVEPGTIAAEHDSPPLGDVDRDLIVDPAASAFLADWFAFATAVLEELRVAPGAVDAGRVQLWPGHFDVAVEVGDEAAGRRATYGASPGDADHPEPYLYVGPWSPADLDDDVWNDPTFGGASLPYAELVTATDPADAALAFYGRALTTLARQPPG